MHFASHQQVEHRQQYLQLHRGSTKAWGRTHGIGKELLRGALHIAFSQGWAVGINWTQLISIRCRPCNGSAQCPSCCWHRNSARQIVDSSQAVWSKKRFAFKDSGCTETFANNWKKPSHTKYWGAWVSGPRLKNHKPNKSQAQYSMCDVCVCMWHVCSLHWHPFEPCLQEQLASPPWLRHHYCKKPSPQGATASVHRIDQCELSMNSCILLWAIMIN